MVWQREVRELEMKSPVAQLLLLPALACLAGCGALSTHQSPKLMTTGERAWTAGFASGRLSSCEEDTSSVAFGNGCVLTLDPYFGWRWGIRGDASNPKDLLGDRNGEVGVKFSGVPFLGGTILADLRVQSMVEPAFMSYDFGLSIFPCLSGALFEDEEDASDIVDQDKEHSCGDLPYGGGVYAGFTFGKEWLYAGMKYGIGGTSWDGLQLLPGIHAGSALGPRWFKVIPAVDVYFYQWPLETKPDLRILYGVGLQGSF